MTRECRTAATEDAGTREPAAAAPRGLLGATVRAVASLRWLVLPCLVAALPALAAPPRSLTLQFHDWYPGHMPGRHDRQTVTLALDGGVATLEARTELPPREERRRFNVSAWTPAEEPPRRLDGTVKHQAEGFTATFSVETGGTLTLACVAAVERVHEAGATVTPGACSPCYDGCTAPPIWVPATTHPRRGWSCRVKSKAASEDQAPPEFRPLETRAFFAEAPGLEFVSGSSDCPPRGLRELGVPPPEWAKFPEGTTALRDVRVKWKEKPPPVVTTLVRKKNGVEVTHDGVRYAATALRELARSEDGQRTLALSCWRESRTVHSEDLRFALAPGPQGHECEGQDDFPKSRGPRQQSALVCRPVVDGVARDELLEFAPGSVVERLDLNNGCSRRRALRRLTSLETPVFGAGTP